jgi:hypothetical protein
MGKPNAKGRNKGGFVMVHHFLMNSPAYRDLSGTSVKLLLHLMRLSCGNNGYGFGKGEPGQLFLAEREAAEAIGVARNTVSKAFLDLVEHGFLRPVSVGHFHVKTRVATTWRLTFEPHPQGRRGPTNEWRDYQAKEKQRAQKLNGTGANIDPVTLDHEDTGSISAPVEKGNGENPPTSTGLRIAPHLYMPRVEADSATANAVMGVEGEAKDPSLVDGLIADPATATLVRFPSPTCERCSGPFLPGDRGKPKRFCSEDCRKKAEIQRRRDRLRNEASSKAERKQA